MPDYFASAREARKSLVCRNLCTITLCLDTGPASRILGNIVDCKTVGFFFSKSVKKSVKRGVIVLRARSARAMCEREGKRRLFPVSLSVFSLVPDLLFDCSRVLKFLKNRLRIKWDLIESRVGLPMTLELDQTLPLQELPIVSYLTEIFLTKLR